jgi:glycosyltransferase involved in cell wall biosynthesis
MDFNDVTIVVPTFLRDGCLQETLGRIQRHLPDCKVVVVDDGYQTRAKDYLYSMMRTDGHQAVYLPFDTGLSAKRNVGVRLANTRYIVIASDDYAFDAVSRSDFTMWKKALTGWFRLVGGRVNDRPYEGFLTLTDGVMEERLWKEGDPVHHEGGLEIREVDIVCNYFMAYRDFLLQYPWDEQFKIGGEHGDFFWRIKKALHPSASASVGFVPGVNVNQAERNRLNWDINFPLFRGRAMQYHVKFMQKWGIKEYRGMDATSNVRIG